MIYQPSRLTEYTREAMLSEIQRVVSVHLDGVCPTQRQFNEWSRVHSATIVKEFGSWSCAMQAAGLDPLARMSRTREVKPDSREVTAEVLLTELAAIARRHKGDALLYDEYRRLGGTRARGTFCKYLGGWRKAVASLGLRDGFARRRPDLRTHTGEDYFAAIQQVWELLGRQPKSREMRGHGKMPSQ